MSTQDRREGQRHIARPLGKGLGAALATPNGPSAGDFSEREQFEEALRRREQEISVLADNVPALFSYVDAGGRYRFANKRYEEWFGIPRTEIVGKHYSQVLGEATHERIGHFVERALLGEHVRFEDEMPYRSGGTRWVSADYVPDTDDRGVVKGFFALVTDITERKRSEEALRESEERFRLIARTTSDVIWDSDLTTGRVWRSEGMQRLFGYGPGQEDPRMTWWYERMHPEDRDGVVTGIYAVITRGNESWFGEYRFRRADGSYAHVHDRSYVIRDDDGRPVRLIGGITDISERKRAEVALRESERRYRLVAEGATDIIWIRDVNLRTTYVNAAVTRIRGYSVEEVMAQSLEEVLTPASLDVARKAFTEELAEGEVERDLSWRRTLELEATCKDGSTVWLDTRVTALRDENWRVAGVLGVSRDITERKRAEEALQEAREELESRVERHMRRDSAYGLTFRELTVLHLVVAGKSDKEIGAVLGISVLTASKHLANILRKMGAASRTEAGVRALREGLLD